MRRYAVRVGERDFVIDVQERAADRFDVVVDGQAFDVALGAGNELAGSDVAPAVVAAPAVAATTVARPPSASPPPRRNGNGASHKASLNAPMPGVILELFVKPGDVVTRGQQVAVLDAMKMHNFIGAPRDGTIAEVCVEAGQAVGHGDAILRFAP